MNDLQRTEGWLLARKGMITASEIYLLLGNHKEIMTDGELAEYKKANPKGRSRTKEAPFSQQSFTYLDGKVMERLMTDDAYLAYHSQSKPTIAMQWGTEHEYEAGERYMLETGADVIDMPFVPLKGHEKYSGGSPDGALSDGNGIVEYKCPYNPAIHLRHYLYQTPGDLKEDNLQYYCQCAWNMVCTGAQFCDFVSWSPFFDARHQVKILRLPYDHEMAEQLKEREALAEKYIDQRIEEIRSSKEIIITYNE